MPGTTLAGANHRNMSQPGAGTVDTRANTVPWRMLLSFIPRPIGGWVTRQSTRNVVIGGVALQTQGSKYWYTALQVTGILLMTVACRAEIRTLAMTNHKLLRLGT